jgi:AcrR family transcriptional regulator
LEAHAYKVVKARLSTLEDKRREFLPVVAGAFAELGYRRLTSAELAARCGLGEKVLYRIWPDKQAMFLAALEWVYLASERTWESLLAEGAAGEGAFLRLLSHEADHHGEHGLYRIVFAGLSETDDPRLRGALRDLYGRFHAFVRRQITVHRERGSAGDLDVETAVWAIVGLGTVANLVRELELASANRRGALFWEAGRLLAEGCIAPRTATRSADGRGATPKRGSSGATPRGPARRPRGTT